MMGPLKPFIVLALLFPLSLRADLLYDLSFPESLFQEGGILYVDGSIQTPSSINMGTQEVRHNYAGLEGSWAIFNTPVCGQYDQIHFDLGSRNEIYLEASVHTSQLNGSDNNFGIHLDSTGYSARSLGFHGLGSIRLFNYGSNNLVSFADNTTYHIQMYANASADLLTINIDGVEQYSGPLGSTDITKVRMSLSPWTGNAQNCAGSDVALSDIKIYESPDDLSGDTGSTIGTAINLQSDPGDYIGQGQNYSYTDDNAEITYSRNYDNGIRILIRNLPNEPSLSWTLNMAAIGEVELVAGEYLGAQRFPVPNAQSPGLSFSGQGRGCNNLTGSFEISEVSYDSNGDVLSLRASFDQYCDESSSALRGTIEYNVSPSEPPEPVPSTPLPTFMDPNLQGCLMEQAQLNNWDSVEEFERLLCPNRGIQDTVGLDQLFNLRELDLSGNPLQHSNNAVQTLPPQLEDLNLSNTGLTEMYGTISFDHLTQLRRLDISENMIVNLPGLSNQLRRLNISGTSLGGFNDLLALNNLIELRANYIHTPTNGQWLAQEAEQIVANNPQLQIVGFSGLPIGDSFQFFQNLSVQHLEELELSDTGMTSVPVALDQYDSLTSIDLSHNPITYLSPINQLKELNVSHTKLMDLNQLLGLNELIELRANNIQFASEVPIESINYQLQQLVSTNPQLKVLGINGLNLIDPYDPVGGFFAALPPQIQVLELSDTGLLDFPLTHLPIKRLNLSDNPIAFINLNPLNMSLEALDLSKTQLEDLFGLEQLTNLKELRLGDTDFSAGYNPMLQQQLQTILMNNDSLVILGLNDINFVDHSVVFNALSPNLQVLELRNTGLSDMDWSYLPPYINEFSSLHTLDLSSNPITSVGPLVGSSLRHLNLSTTSLFNLNELSGINGLIELQLNDVPVNEYMIENMIMQNPHIVHLGMNGIMISDSQRFFNEILGWRPFESLSIANTGLSELSLTPPTVQSLKVLDLSDNLITSADSLSLDGAENMESLNLANNQLINLAGPFSFMNSLQFLSLAGNDQLFCVEIDALEQTLDPTVELIRPQQCQQEQTELDYCSANGMSTSYEWIDSVVINGMANMSGSNGGYGDYSGQITPVAPGENIMLDLVPGYRSYNYTEQWVVWVDFNRNGDFEPFEQVFSGSGNNVVNTNFMVPLDATQGDVRMRVAMRWGGTAAPCGSYTWGEVEDYTLSVTW